MGSEASGTDQPSRLDRLKAWYRRSGITRGVVVPWSGAFGALSIPLIYEADLFTPEYRVVIYVVAAAAVAAVSLWHSFFEREEAERLQRAVQDAESRADKADNALKEYIRVVATIRDIVREKSHRFVTACKEFKARCDSGEQVDGGDVFATITQPDAQIEVILQNLASLFWSGREDRVIKVALFRPDFERGHFRYFKYYPKDHKPSMPEAKFRLDVGVAGRALQRNDLVMLEDIGADVHGGSPTYFLTDNTGPDPVGAIACFPIRDAERDLTCYVLSVYIDEPSAFREELKDYYRRVIFEPFAERILVEDRLLFLRENCIRVGGESNNGRI